MSEFPADIYTEPSHVLKPEQLKTYHEQVGYWLWEPATGTVIHTFTIPRGQSGAGSPEGSGLREVRGQEVDQCAHLG
jgi:hypothetical protein